MAFGTCFAMELEREAAQLEEAAYRCDTAGDCDTWWRTTDQSSQASQGVGTCHDQAPMLPDCAQASKAPAPQQQPQAPPQQPQEPQAPQQQQQQRNPEVQLNPHLQQKSCALEPAKVVHLKRQVAVRTHGTLLRRTPAVRQPRCNGVLGTPAPAIKAVQTPAPVLAVTPATAAAAAFATPLAPIAPHHSQLPCTWFASEAGVGPGSSCNNSGGAVSAERSPSSASERVCIPHITHDVHPAGPCPLARLTSCDSDQDAFHTATSPNKPPTPPACCGGSTSNTYSGGVIAAGPLAACGLSLCCGGAYWDVADSADDLAMSGPRHFIRHDLEDVIDVVMTTAGARARGALSPCPQGHCAEADAGGAGDAAAASEVLPGGALLDCSAPSAAAGHGISGETAAAASAAQDVVDGVRPGASAPPQALRVSVLDGGWSAHETLTACSATGSPMVAAMQPNDFSMSPSVLPPGCSIPSREAPSSLVLESSPLSPSPLPSWPRRRHPLVPITLWHSPQETVSDQKAGVLLAGAFPPSRLGSDEQHGSGKGAGAAVEEHQLADTQQRPSALRVRRARVAAALKLQQAAADLAAVSDDDGKGQQQGDSHLGDEGVEEGAAAAAGVADQQDAEANESDGADGGAAAARGKKRPSARLLTRPHGLGCVNCGATSTPVWRTGPRGPKTLCNRCGVRFSKMARRK